MLNVNLRFREIVYKVLPEDLYGVTLSQRTRKDFHRHDADTPKDRLPSVLRERQEKTRVVKPCQLILHC